MEKHITSLTHLLYTVTIYTRVAQDWSKAKEDELTRIVQELTTGQEKNSDSDFFGVLLVIVWETSEADNSIE